MNGAAFQTRNSRGSILNIAQCNFHRCTRDQPAAPMPRENPFLPLFDVGRKISRLPFHRRFLLSLVYFPFAQLSCLDFTRSTLETLESVLLDRLEKGIFLLVNRFHSRPNSQFPSVQCHFFLFFFFFFSSSVYLPKIHRRASFGGILFPSICIRTLLMARFHLEEGNFAATIEMEFTVIFASQT